MATLGTIEPDFLDRLGDALGSHDADPDDRTKIIDALNAGATSYETLPPDVQKIVRKLESSPRTSWDDPSDVPGNAPLEG